jgi:hypothetical protein
MLEQLQLSWIGVLGTGNFHHIHPFVCPVVLHQPANVGWMKRPYVLVSLGIRLYS